MTEKTSRITAEAIWDDLRQIKTLKSPIHFVDNHYPSFVVDCFAMIGGNIYWGDRLASVFDTLEIARVLGLSMRAFEPVHGQDNFNHLEDLFQQKISRSLVLDLYRNYNSPYRKRTSRKIVKKFRPAIVRGGIWEILEAVPRETRLEIFPNEWNTHWEGDRRLKVDMVDSVERFARATGCVTVLSDEMKLVSDGHTTYQIVCGDDTYTSSPDIKTLETILMVAFMEVNESPLVAAVRAMSLMGVLTETASESATGPGSFKAALLDSLHNLELSGLINRLRYNALGTRAQLITAEMSFATAVR